MSSEVQLDEEIQLLRKQIELAKLQKELGKAVSESSEKPTTEKTEKRENVYREQIPLDNTPETRRAWYAWIETKDILKWMQESDLNSYKFSIPVNEMSELYCRDIKHEWAAGLRDCMRRKLHILEKKGLAERKTAFRKTVSVPILPKDINFDDDEAPVLLKYKTFGVNADFWYLTKKGLKA